MNSGVGAKEELASVGIPVVHDLPGVGKNLHDHVLFPLDFFINETEFNNLTWASALDYLLFRKGPLSGVGKVCPKWYLNKQLHPFLPRYFVNDRTCTFKILETRG